MENIHGQFTRGSSKFKQLPRNAQKKNATAFIIVLRSARLASRYISLETYPFAPKYFLDRLMEQTFIEDIIRRNKPCGWLIYLK